MKKENGVTMISLVVYVAVMTIVIAVMSSIITNFYSNTDTAQGNVQEVVEFNKFNNYFLKEVKSNSNEVDHISADNSYILFASGNSFSISERTVYYNNIKICNGVENIRFTLEQDTEDEEGEYTIINVTLDFINFNKSMKYKLENIY